MTLSERISRGRVKGTIVAGAIPTLAWLLVLLAVVPAGGETFSVSLSGDDRRGNGSENSPWRTIEFALNRGISRDGGHVVVVEDGVYDGCTTVRRGFMQPVTVRAKHAYGARLTNVSGGYEVVRIGVRGSAKLTFDGFQFTNSDPDYTCHGREQHFVIHIRDASDVTIQNSIIHGNAAAGCCNELVKINRTGAAYYPKNIVIRGNVFYDHAAAAGADMLDSVGAGEVEIVDNIFWAAPSNTLSQSFITIKRQARAGGDAASPRYRLQRNIFLNWGGKSDQAFIQLGEDGIADIEASDALIENNLFIGNSSRDIVAALQLKGAQNVVVRANTIVGDLPGGSYGLRIGTEGSNPEVSGFSVRNNVFSDPTGTMGDRFIDVYGRVDTSTIMLDSNLFFNAGVALPTVGPVTPADDQRRIVADPLLPKDHVNLVLPKWDAGASAFTSGRRTIRGEFQRLVESYGALAAGSPAIDAADGAHMPADDIRGRPRDDNPDMGAYEFGAQQK